MNKRFTIFTCLLLVAVMLTACGKEKKNETTATTTGDPTQEVTQVTIGDDIEATEDTQSTVPPEDKVVEMTDPITGEITDAQIGIGVEEGENVPVLEDDEPSDPTEELNPTESVKPTESTEPEVPSQPTDITTPTLPNGLDIRDITYEMYMNMSGEEQQAVIAQFGSIEDFMVWFNAVKAIYEAKHPNIEVGGNSTVDGSQIGNQ